MVVQGSFSELAEASIEFYALWLDEGGEGPFDFCTGSERSRYRANLLFVGLWSTRKPPAAGCHLRANACERHRLSPASIGWECDVETHERILLG